MYVADGQWLVKMDPINGFDSSVVLLIELISNCGKYYEKRRYRMSDSLQ
jgi:hypothetical protein